MVFNVTFYNILAISWRSVVLVEETNDLPQVSDKCYPIMLYRVRLTWAGVGNTTLVILFKYSVVQPFTSAYNTSMTCDIV